MTVATSSDAGFIGSGTGTDSGNPLAASADFSYSAGTLTIILKNTSTFDYASSPNSAKAVPTDILTALFFDYNGGFGPSMSLTLATTPAVTVGSNPATLVVPPTSGGWEYQESASSLTGVTQHYGLGTAGFGVFDGNATNLPTPAWQYGIINNKYVDGEGNPSVNGSILAKDSITFTLTVTGAFDVTKIGNVRFQYGTALNEGSFGGTTTVTINEIPEPASFVLAVIGGLGAVVVGRRRREQAV